MNTNAVLFVPAARPGLPPEAVRYTSEVILGQLKVPVMENAPPASVSGGDAICGIAADASPVVPAA
jgi:hypothetical protein